MREITATILENTPIAEGIFALTFATEEAIPVQAGQFAMIGLRGFPLRRPLAICKAEGERITVCYRLNGEGTRSLANEFRAREKLPVLLPLGNGFSLKDSQRRVAVVGGGVGIFPLIAAIRQYAADREIYAYMGFRDRESVCMEYEMGRGKRLLLATDDGSCGYHGTAVQAFMGEIDKVRPDVVLSCGPTPMLRALKVALTGKKIPAYVSLEERMGCGIGACLVCVCKKTDGQRARVCKDGPVFEINEVEL